METLLVIGLLAALSVIVVPVGLGYVRTYSLISERDILGSLLTSARAKALANNNSSYSVYFDNTAYVLFSGSTYSKGDPTNEVTAAHAMVTRTPESAVITFAPLSAQTEDKRIVLENAGHSVFVQVSSEGAIEW